MNLFPQIPRLRRRTALRWPSQAQVVRLNQGDRVLVVCDRDVTPEQMTGVTDWLRGRFPGVEFTAIGGDGIQSVIVQSADHEEAR